MSTRWVELGLLLMLAMLPTAEACKFSGVNPLNEPTNLGSWEDSLVFYAEVDGTTPFLSYDNNPAGPSSFADARLGVTTGVPSIQAALTGGAPAFVEFPLRAPLASDHFLNLSKPVKGTLWLSTTAQQTAAQKDGYAVRVEVFVGTQRVGGQDYVVSAPDTRAAWAFFHYCFRPEVRLLPAGEAVTRRVTRLSSVADLIIGTGGNQQTLLEMRYFPNDPLSTAVYVEGGTLVPLAPGGEESDPRPGFGAVALLGLVALALRRPRIPRLAVLLLVTGAFAGCLASDTTVHSSESEDSRDLEPTAIVTIKDLPPAGNQTGAPPPTHGELEGIVMDPNGLPLEKANVLLVGSIHFAATDKAGAFHFANLTPATYTLRADRTGFEAFEGAVEVPAAKLVHVDITLTYPLDKEAGEKPHIHDDWAGQVEKEFLATTLKPAWRYTAPPVVQVTTTLKDPPTAATPVSAERSEGCAGFGTCEWDIPNPDDGVILPGTALVTVKLSWNANANGAPKAIQLGVATATNKSVQLFVPRGPNDVFSIPIFPTEADSGHVKFTDWRFYVRLVRTEHDHPFGSFAYTAMDLSIQIKIYKGVVPFEPPHRDFWNGNDRIELFTAAARGPGSCLNCDYPYSVFIDAWNLGGLNLPMVPPETLEIQGRLQWGGTTPTLTQWSIAYRPADMPLRADKLPTYPKAKITTEGSDFTEFVIKLDKGKGADQYYQRLSRWVFLVDDQDDPGKNTNSGYGTTWKLTAAAIRDPGR